VVGKTKKMKRGRHDYVAEARHRSEGRGSNEKARHQPKKLLEGTLEENKPPDLRSKPSNAKNKVIPRTTKILVT